MLNGKIHYNWPFSIAMYQITRGYRSWPKKNLVPEKESLVAPHAPHAPLPALAALAALNSSAKSGCWRIPRWTSSWCLLVSWEPARANGFLGILMPSARNTVETCGNRWPKSEVWPRSWQGVGSQSQVLAKFKQSWMILRTMNFRDGISSPPGTAFKTARSCPWLCVRAGLPIPESALSKRNFPQSTSPRLARSLMSTLD